MTGTDERDAEAGADRIPDAGPTQTPLWILLSRWLLALEAWLRSHGGRRLRVGLRAFWGVVAATGLFLLLGPVINAPLTFDDILDSASTATDTWIARDFHADYQLSRDDQGRLRAAVTETITANFPDGVDQSGIQRVLATAYEGHALDPSSLVASLDGAPIGATQHTSPDGLTIDLDAGATLTGDHEFVLRYTLQDLAYPTTDDASGQEVDLLQWSVFGPSWPQAVAALEVSVSMPDDLAGQLIRQPRGAISWTLVSGGDWLDPEADPPSGTTVYAFTSDDTLPPNAQAWFTMPFASGTFAMPPPTPLFLLQTFGPLLPLAFLVLTLLFAMAARAVAWSDARGRPWFVAQYDPPAGIDPQTAAQILRTPRTRELALAVAELQHGAAPRRERLLAVGRAARRAGRVGDRLRAATAFRFDPARRGQLRQGYRRIPRGFVRDWFLLAPLALSVLQIGLVRQLSHQTVLAVVWWPAAFVVVSLLLAAAIVAIALATRPLTRKGALARQHLRGIQVYADRTGLLRRTTLTDRLLPYAVLGAEPREAGRSIEALIVAELGGTAELARWRTRDFLTWPRLLIRAAAAMVVVGTVLVIALAPNPYLRESTVEDWDFTAPGTLYTQVDAVTIDAALSRDRDTAQLAVTERVDVAFDDDAARVPQFAQMFPTRTDGQDLGLTIGAVRVDGDGVPFTTLAVRDRLEVTTALSQVLSGAHTVEIEYSVAYPVTAGRGSPVSGETGEIVDRMRWAALLDGWDSGWTYPSEPDVTLAITVADDIADSALSAGWLREDPDTAESARDWQESVLPFGDAESELIPSYGSDEAADGTLRESVARTDGAMTATIAVTPGEYGYPTDSLYSDLGVLLEFPAGTFAGPDAGALQAQEAYRVAPIALVWALASIALLVAVAAVLRAALRGRRTPPGALRDLVWLVGPAAGAASAAVFVWASIDMPDDWPEFPPLIIGAAVGLLAALVCGIAIRPQRREARVSRSRAAG